MGKRAAGVLIVLLRMKSARSNPEKKCGLPDASRVVALLIPLGAKMQGANLGAKALTLPPAQPGPSPGTGNDTGIVTGGVPGMVIVPPVVVAPTANAPARRRASGLFQCWFRNDAVADHGPALKLVWAWAPRT